MINHFVYSLGPTSCIYSDYVRHLEKFSKQKIFYLKGIGDSGHEEHISVWRSLRVAGFDGVLHFHSVHFFATLVVASLFRRKTVFTVHTSWSNYSSIHKVMCLICLVFSRAVVFVSEASIDSFPGFVVRYISKKKHVINNAFDCDAVCPSPIKSGWIVCGRMVPLKNIPSAIDLFLRFKRENEVLTVIGDGPLKESLEWRYEEQVQAGLINFTGALERKEVYANLEGAGVFVSMSSVEGLPISVLEAMAAGCKILLSNIPAHRPFFSCEMVFNADHVNEPGFEERFFSSNLLTSYDFEVGRNFVRENYGAELFSSSYLKVYEAL